MSQSGILLVYSIVSIVLDRHAMRRLTSQLIPSNLRSVSVVLFLAGDPFVLDKHAATATRGQIHDTCGLVSRGCTFLSKEMSW